MLKKHQNRTKKVAQRAHVHAVLAEGWVQSQAPCGSQRITLSSP